ncbi:MAG: DNA-directed RNA polymerase subunit F [Methanobrevibacter arboriphilus]|jgi:DNA-directed RNA polymerase subunit F|uniref:DNA-directed RNA polymerase subunit Rpo4 n=2 Tax=Methanobrevibacter arboriphilus TaxID=39441 RepID=A0A843ANR4_METAZ|nr:RNA polymerase Rpb4 family protein [Methanobrevibacter arboriphilus]MBF4468919.1 DNA-directed RNA polymerase subunit F [Methanobrevibacter arboriphilus]BBL62281.1 DNA-directed RNA polymerase subunit F [Methanobrevibacter arboriphilus]GLI11474.1 DNA-directed RNA polymerase subunit F [Methanobrevibacter arboriphilus]
MIGKKALENEPIPAAKVKEILEDFQEKYELSYEQNLTLDHVTKFNKLSLEDTEELIGKLEEIVKKKHAVRIADLMPKDLSDLRLLFAKERLPISKEELEEILSIVDEYRDDE